MQITTNQNGEVTVVAIDDRLEADTVEAFRTSMHDLAEQGQVKLVLDFSNISFVDSSGLGGLVSAVRKFRQHDGDIKLACINDNVRPLVEIVRLHRIFDIFDAVDEAVNSFS